MIMTTTMVMMIFHFISFHFIYCYYKNKFLYKSPHEGVLTSYVIYLPTYLRFEIYYRMRNIFVYIHIPPRICVDIKKEMISLYLSLSQSDIHTM